MMVVYGTETKLFSMFSFGKEKISSKYCVASANGAAIEMHYFWPVYPIMPTVRYVVL